LLERLTEIRGFMLIFECEEESEDLLCKLVSTCLAAARSASAEAGSADGALVRLETQLAQLLTGILDEADEIPKPVISSLVEELMPRQRASAAAGLVRRVLAGLASRSAALPINDFLNNSLYSEDTLPQSEQAGGGDRPAMPQDRLEALLCAVYELYAIEPALMARVLPNLDSDLQSVDPDRRRMVTALVGQMLAHAPAGDDAPASFKTLASTHPLMVDHFRDRLGDADDGVRLTALEGVSTILTTAATISDRGSLHDAGHAVLVSTSESLRTQLLERCIDPNDAVRLRAVQLAADVASASKKGLELLLPVLPEMFRRILDKKPRVREDCAEAAAHLYATHALPAWTDGKYLDAQALTWIPQLLCEAYSVYSASRLGHVAELEEYVEQHILACGAGLEVQKRALLLLGFHSSASQGEEPVRGLALLLGKKRDANAALRRFLKARMAKAAPLVEMAAGVGTLVPSQGPDVVAKAPGTELLENLARHSPTLEDNKAGRLEATLVHLRALDAVRDKALWTQLERLMNPCILDATQEITDSLQELDRLLRIHRLRELAPLIRRALISTWLLPEQVKIWLDLWKGSWPSSEFGSEAPCQELRDAAQQLVADLPRYFPGAFLPYAQEIATHLKDSSTSEARAALRALAAISKRQPSILPEGPEGSQVAASIDPATLDEELKDAIGVAGKDVATRGSACRKAAKVVALLHKEKAQEVTEKLLEWAEANISADHAMDECGEHLTASALHLAAALLAARSDKSTQEGWLEAARTFLGTGSEASSDVRCAAADLVAAAGGEDEIAEILLAPAPASDVLPIESTPAEPTEERPTEEGKSEAALPLFDPLLAHAACVAFRALRSGAVPLTTRLLARLAGRICASLTPGRPTCEAEQLLQCLQQPSAPQVRLVDRIRLCTTFPSVFALATLKRHRDTMQRMLTAAFIKTARQSLLQQQPLLDYSVACFVHFLSRLELFKREASAKASAYPESSKVSAFFFEALLRSDPQKGVELAGVALRVCERVRYFVDREEPTSDAVHRSASVLRYVIEKRCPELGVQGAALLQGSTRGSMPADLFAIRQAPTQASRSTPALAAPEAPALDSSPLVPASEGSELSSPTRSLARVEAESPLETKQTSPVPITTPRRRQSLLKRGATSASPAPVQAEDGMEVSSVARPMAGQGGSSPNLTGAVMKAALSARDSAKKAKRGRTSPAGGSEAKQPRVA